MNTGERQWRPTKPYFEQNSRSVILRNLCLKAIDVAELALSGEGEETETMHDIFELNTALHELGVKPNMHAIDRKDPRAETKRVELMSNPVQTAEWLAGQVCTALESGATARPVDISDISEHDELEGRGGGVSLAELISMSPSMSEFLTNFTLIGALKSFIDYSAGPTEE